LKFAPMAILAMALLKQHDARWDIQIELAARRRAAIEAQGHSELGAQSGRKNQLACSVLCDDSSEVVWFAYFVDVLHGCIASVF